MSTLGKIMDGGASATRLMIRLAMNSFVQLGLDPRDIIDFSSVWADNGQFVLEVTTLSYGLLFLYRDGEVLLLAKEEVRDER